jgi:hypothetical protein
MGGPLPSGCDATTSERCHDHLKLGNTTDVHFPHRLKRNRILRFQALALEENGVLAVARNRLKLRRGYDACRFIGTRRLCREGDCRKGDRRAKQSTDQDESSSVLSGDHADRKADRKAATGSDRLISQTGSDRLISLDALGMRSVKYSILNFALSSILINCRTDWPEL